MTAKEPIPVPTSRDLFRWANSLTSYLRSLEASIEQPSPKAVQLEHQKVGAKATTEGMLMYDPVKKAVVVAISKAWRLLSVGLTWNENTYQFTDASGNPLATLTLDNERQIMGSDTPLVSSGGAWTNLCSVNLVPGTWLIVGHTTIAWDSNGGNIQAAARIITSIGGGSIASGTASALPSSGVPSYFPFALSTLYFPASAATVTLQGRNTGGPTNPKALATGPSTGSERSTQISALRIA